MKPPRDPRYPTQPQEYGSLEITDGKVEEHPKFSLSLYIYNQLSCSSQKDRKVGNAWRACREPDCCRMDMKKQGDDGVTSKRLAKVGPGSRHYRCTLASDKSLTTEGYHCASHTLTMILILTLTQRARS